MHKFCIIQQLLETFINYITLHVKVVLHLIIFTLMTEYKIQLSLC